MTEITRDSEHEDRERAETAPRVAWFVAVLFLTPPICILAWFYWRAGILASMPGALVAASIITIGRSLAQTPFAGFRSLISPLVLLWASSALAIGFDLGEPGPLVALCSALTVAALALGGLRRRRASRA